MTPELIDWIEKYPPGNAAIKDWLKQCPLWKKGNSSGGDERKEKNGSQKDNK